MRSVFGASFICALKFLDRGVAGVIGGGCYWRRVLLAAMLVLEMGFNWGLTPYHAMFYHTIPCYALLYHTILS